jgi:hypothetical protein
VAGIPLEKFLEFAEGTTSSGPSAEELVIEARDNCRWFSRVFGKPIAPESWLERAGEEIEQARAERN